MNTIALQFFSFLNPYIQEIFNNDNYALTLNPYSKNRFQWYLKIYSDTTHQNMLFDIPFNPYFETVNWDKAICNIPITLEQKELIQDFICKIPFDDSLKNQKQ